jgi:hypothetical protein
MKRKTLIAALCLALLLSLLPGCTFKFPYAIDKPSASPTAEAASEEYRIAHDAAVADYLDKHSSEIVVGADGTYQSGLEALDTSKYDIFLSGEAHATRKNYDAELALIQYLHEKAGVRYILMESGFAATAYLNMYLQSGDQNIPLQIMAELAGTPSCNDETLEFWQKLYRYNESLPPEERLTAVGIDIEHQAVTAYLYMQLLLENKEIPQEIEVPLKTITAFPPNLDDQGIAVAMNKLRSDIDKNRSLYQECLGEDFYNFEFAVNNTLTGIKAYDKSTKNFDAFREQAICSNFLSVYEHYGKGKYFGQFGSEHVFQSHCNTDYLSADSDRLAILLNTSDSPVDGRVCTILYTYVTCSAMNQNGSFDLSENSLAQAQILSDYGESGSMTLFDLRAEGSPFGKNPIFIKPPANGVTLNYFQYLVLIKNSGACSPYEPG